MKKLLTTIAAAIGIAVGSATALADSINLSEVTADTNVVDGTTLTGTLGANVKISIADGATVTLKDVTITNLGNGCHWAGINCPGDAILVLEGANTVCAGGNSSGYHNYPGIWIAPEKTLTIQGDGSLTAYSGTGNAGWGSGIGGGYEIDCGNIVIEGGAITATGGKSAAGIGCGYYGACGDITITGGTIVSTGGTYSSALGGGCGATCGDITIAATVTSLTATSTPTSGAVSDCIGAGSEGGTCGTVTIGGVTGPVLDSPFTFMPVDLAGLTEDTTIPDGAALCGTLAGNVKISIAPGAKVTLNGADINGDGTWTDGDYAGITCEGNATIILRGENNVKGFNADYPGIYVPEGSTLTIQGEGALDASSNGAGAGIGGGNGIACGNIVIAGGVITATGGTGAAGIGGGSGAACGDITITDASFGVTATKGEDAPYSIGAGKDGTGGTVTIGNEVGAIEDSPYTCNPPIDLSNVTEARTIPDGKTITGTLGATVKISIARNATVTLKDATINGVHNTEHYYAWSWAGITCEGDATIILEGENAVRGFCADYPGIFVPEGSTLTIQGEGSLDASSNGWGAGIGGGDGSEYYISCGNIVIEGGTIVATGGKYAAAIGSGENSDCGTITIADSVTSVTAIKGDNAPYSIGAGSDGSCGTVTIGGTVYPDGIAESPYIYPTYTATLKDGTEDAANWTITPSEGLVESNTVTVAYAGENKVKSVKAKKGTEEITVTPVEGKTNEWTFVMPAADVEVEVAYLAVATFDVDGETYAVITNVVGEAVATPEEDPVKIGHTFAGWFTEATGGTQVTDETLMGAADTTFYAQFRAPILTIENGVLTGIDLNGCTNLNLVIPDTVTAIGDSAFYQCTGLASVTIPGSVKTISHAAFRDCSGLTSVTIEEGATTIGERAFARCVNLASITIPGTVTEISEAAFSDCKSLTSLTIPGSVKTIGPQAFQNCTGLESVTIEEGVETIGRVAFDGCENLASVTIPDSVKEIGDDAFAGCSDALYEEGSGNLAGVKLVDGWAVGYDAGSISENLDLTGVRGIAGGAFAGCDFITSVIIPDGVATIPEYAFNGCDNLTGVTIPDSVTSIGEGAFGGCDNLASVTIPDSVTSIGKDAFEGCNEELFDTTTIPGVALVDGWAVGYTDALPENLDLSGARGIADNAFRDSTLESVTIPGTVARVPAGAFMSCSSLASVTLEEGVTAIDDSAFIECSALESVEIPDTVTAIGPQAFVACAKLASVTVPGSVAEIGPAAFGMCNSLTNITIEAGVTNIGMMAFAMCSALESVEIPGTVTAIGSQAFLMSMNLASVTIPASVKEIGKDAFLYTALSTVYVEYGDGERVKALLAASGFDTDNLEFVETSSPLPVYRFYSKNYKGHFFTIDEEEKEYIIANNRNWSLEGTAYRAFTNQVPGTVALHRFYSKNYRGHFFTVDADEAEAVKLNRNWKYEGIAYYVYPEEVEGSVPVFRFWSKGYRHHFYTIDESEKNALIATNPNWAYEGEAFYALPAETVESGVKSLKKSVLSAAVGSRGVLALSAADGGATGAGLRSTLDGGDAAGSGLRATLGGGRGATSLPDETSSLTEWTLSAEDGTAIAEPGTTEVGEILVETLQDVPDYAEFEEDASRAERQTVSLHLVLPAGVWRAKLWSAVDGEGDEESAEGALDFELPATGVWHWLLVAPEDAENPDSPAYSLWIRATAD